MATFGERLAELRKEKQLSQADFAGLFKLGQSTIGMYETNKREPDSTTLKKFADFFRVTIDYLLGREYTFADYVKELRNKKGLSTRQLAIELDVSESTILELEKGKIRPGVDTIRKIAKTFSINYNDLLVLAGYGDLANRLEENKGFLENSKIELLDALEDSKNVKITAGGQPLTHEQRVSILRALINPAPNSAAPRVPLLGSIKAGIPLFSEQNIIGEVDVPADLQGRVDFALLVSGDSMIGAGIAQNDIVLCKQNKTPQSGQIVAALVNYNETTLKYFIKAKDRTILRAANPNYDDIELKPEDQIQGLVIKVLKDPPPVNAYRDFIYIKEGHNQEWNQVIEDAISYGIKPEQVRNMMEVQWGMLKKMLGRA